MYNLVMPVEAQMYSISYALGFIAWTLWIYFTILLTTSKLLKAYERQVKNNNSRNAKLFLLIQFHFSYGKWKWKTKYWNIC